MGGDARPTELKDRIGRQVALIGQMRRMLAAVLPIEITQMPAGEPDPRDATGRDTREASALLGLGPDLGIANPGYTGEFDVVRSGDPTSQETGIPPMTIPLPIIELTPEGAGASGRAVARCARAWRSTTAPV